MSKVKTRGYKMARGVADSEGSAFIWTAARP